MVDEIFKNYYVHDLYADQGQVAARVLAIRKHGEAKEGGVSSAYGYAYAYFDKKIELHCADVFDGLIMEYAVNNMWRYDD